MLHCVTVIGFLYIKERGPNVISVTPTMNVNTIGNGTEITWEVQMDEKVTI